MKTAERIVMVVLLLVLVGGGAWFYFSVEHKRQSVRDAVARGEYEIRAEDTQNELPTETNYSQYFPELVPIVIGSTTMRASVADSLPERIQGLSDTPTLPVDVVKLFVFDAPGAHSIWMKDMQYALDIMWASKDGTIVHIEENVKPESYPEYSYSSPTPAWYVIETNAGFVASSSIQIGDKLTLNGTL